MKNKEIWKDIKGYEGLYQVSNKGRVKSLDRVVDRTYLGKNFTKKEPGIIRKQQKHPQGYMCLLLCKNSKRKTFRVHRLVAGAFIPNPDNLYAVNHIDGDKSNNDASNLEWCNKSHNERHAYMTGLKQRKLTPHDVIKIRKDDRPLAEIASDYGCSKQNICYVKSGKYWKNV